MVKNGAIQFRSAAITDGDSIVRAKRVYIASPGTARMQMEMGWRAGFNLRILILADKHQQTHDFDKVSLQGDEITFMRRLSALESLEV